MTVATSPVLAAGAVCWRVVDGKPRVLLVHRTQHQDVSLPKGKLDPGETLPQTAQREILEETGVAVSLGAPLGVVEYALPSGRQKVVHYWTAEVSEHALERATFRPNDEIAALEWVSVSKALKRLTYAHDAELVERFAERFAAGRARTFAVIALRHGKAVPPGAWDGPDSTRPLLVRGEAQARSVAPAIAAFAPTKLIASSARRCLSTIAPLAELTGLAVKETADISQDAYEHDEAHVAKVVRKRLAKRHTAVLCSHGPVLPEILSELAAQSNSRMDEALRRAASLDTGEYAVVHFSVDDPRAGIVAVERHSPSPDPA